MKPFWKSKTLWANVIVLVLAVFNGEYGTIPISGTEVGAIVVVLNVVLRFLTTTALSSR